MESKLRLGAEVEGVARDFVDAAVQVHKALGPGLLESAYRACLIHELRSRGRQVDAEVLLPVTYRGMRLDTGYRMDLVVGGCLVAELKAVDTLLPVHRAQLLTYLRVAELPLGFLVNFHAPRLKDGLHRFIGAAVAR
jgi:GxxExxY protein